MFQGKIFFALASFVVLIAAATAFAGKVELTTYYPSPHGEYQELEAKSKLSIPQKTVGNSTANVTVGEIWVEP